MPSASSKQPGTAYQTVSSSSAVAQVGIATFRVPSSMAFVRGTPLTITSTGSTAVLYGVVTFYDGTRSLVSVNVYAYTGSGAHSDWVITLASPVEVGPWITATIDTSLTNSVGYYPISYRTEQFGSVIAFRGEAVSSGTPSSTVVVSLSAPYLPAGEVAFSAAGFLVNTTTGIVTLFTITAANIVVLDGLTIPLL